MSTSAVQIVETQLAAYNRHDIEAFLDCFSDDAEFLDMNGQASLRGREQFRERYSRFWSQHPRVQATIISRIAIGRFVIDQERLVGCEDGPRADLAVIYEVRDAKIARFWVIREMS